MGGFANDAAGNTIVWSDNIDFSGNVIPSRSITTNGQLLIGSTIAPNIQTGVLTSPDSSITIGYSNPNITLQVAGSAPYISLSPYIVGQIGDVHAGYTSIQTAINAASAAGGGNVYIKAGTYTENLTMAAGVNLIGFDPGNSTTFIIGKITASYSGTSCIYGVTLQTNSDYCLAITGSSVTVLYVNNCFINATNNTAINYTSSTDCYVEFDSSHGTLLTTGIAFFSHSSAGVLAFNTGIYGNPGGSTTASTNSSSTAGSCGFRNCYWGNAITTSNSSQFIALATEFQAPLIIGGSGSNTISLCSFEGATSSAISVGASANLLLSNSTINSSNTNAIAGTGTLTYGDITFNGSSTQVANTLTLALDGATPSNATSGKVWTSTGTNTSPTWQSIPSSIAWSDKSGSFSAVAFNGYFITTTATPTLPASPNEGDTISFIVDTTNICTITGNTGQKIRVGTAISASAGTCANNAQGDSITLVYRSTGATWFSLTSPEGTWTIT